METYTDLIEAVQDDSTIGNESVLYPLALVKRAVNRAYRKAGGLFPWPELMDAKKTVTQANVNYYDYPQTWRSRSVWKLTITDSAGEEKRYGEEPDGSPLSFDDFLTWKEDYPDSEEKKWANQWRRYFVTPTPTVLGDIDAGTNVISVWGIMNVTALSDDSDVTIFSYNAPECNEAIVLETVAILKSKGEREKEGEFRSHEAKQILLTNWSRIRKELAKDEKNQPLFNVPNYFGQTSTKDLRGLFDVNI